MGLSSEDSADVLQDVLASLLSGIDRLRDAEALPGWLLRAAYRIALRKRTQGRRETATSDDAFWDRAVDPAPDPSDVVEQLDLALSVRAALARVGGRCAELLEALFLEEPRPSYGELAGRLSVTIGSLGPTRMRCLARLLDEIERSGIKPATRRTSSSSTPPTAVPRKPRRGTR
jgi:DNA-directed RNA polymerase specialized sigma24 family protein